MSNNGQERPLYWSSSPTGLVQEPEFLNFKGAQESIPSNRFRQPM
jgi:hypothetical protein